MGAAGLTGVGIELDTFGNPTCGDAPSNHVGIDTLTGCTSAQDGKILTSLSTAPAPIELADDAWHTAEVKMIQGVATVSIDALFVLKNTVPGVTGVPFFFGFAAGTGGSANSRQQIRNVSILLEQPLCL